MALRRLIVLFFLFSAAAPTQAALIIQEIRAPTGLVMPEIESPTIVIVVAVDCTTLALHNGATSAGGPRPVAFSFMPTGGIVVTGPSRALVPFDPCLAGGSQSIVEADFQVTVPRTTEGLVPYAVEFNVTLESANPVAPQLDPAYAEGSFAITPGAYTRMQAKLAQNLITVEGDRAAVSIEFSNLGNTGVLLVFDGSVTESNGTLVLPKGVQLGSPFGGNLPSTTSVDVGFVAPSGGWGLSAAQITIDPVVVGDPTTHGDPLTVNVLFRNGSAVERATPPPVAAAVFILLLGLAFAQRGSRRRRA